MMMILETCRKDARAQNKGNRRRAKSTEALKAPYWEQMVRWLELCEHLKEQNISNAAEYFSNSGLWLLQILNFNRLGWDKQDRSGLSIRTGAHCAPVSFSQTEKEAKQKSEETFQTDSDTSL